MRGLGCEGMRVVVVVGVVSIEFGVCREEVGFVVGVGFFYLWILALKG